MIDLQPLVLRVVLRKLRKAINKDLVVWQEKLSSKKFVVYVAPIEIDLNYIGRSILVDISLLKHRETRITILKGLDCTGLFNPELEVGKRIVSQYGTLVHVDSYECQRWYYKGQLLQLNRP